MSKRFGIGDILTYSFVFLFIGLIISLGVSMLVCTEYEKNPDYTNSEIFAQGQVQKSVDCYGKTAVKIGGRIVDVPVSIPKSGSWENVELSDLCSDQEFTVYRKAFWLLGFAYTIK